jgi:predicted O-methyltransferase YrrM
MKLSRIPIIGPLISRRDARIAAQAVTDYRASVVAADEAIARVEVPARLLVNCRIVPDRAAMLATLPTGGTWCEVGTADGEFAEQILTVCHPDKLHLIDSWSVEHDSRYVNMEEAVKQRLHGYPIEIHKGYSTDMLALFSDSYFDVIYLDAGHGYSDTVAELELCRQKVKSEGLIAGHDYVTGTWRTQDRYGVIEAVNAFCVQYNWEFVLVTWECHRHISFVLRKIMPYDM